jgi:hypothetical protein
MRISLQSLTVNCLPSAARVQPEHPGDALGLVALFAPRSGEETREWIADTAERKFKVPRRVGRRSFRQPQDAVAEEEEKVTGVLRNGKKALESIAAKLD